MTARDTCHTCVETQTTNKSGDGPGIRNITNRVDNKALEAPLYHQSCSPQISHSYSQWSFEYPHLGLCIYKAKHLLKPSIYNINSSFIL